MALCLEVAVLDGAGSVPIFVLAEGLGVEFATLSVARLSNCEFDAAEYKVSTLEDDWFIVICVEAVSEENSIAVFSDEVDIEISMLSVARLKN